MKIWLNSEHKMKEQATKYSGFNVVEQTVYIVF